MRSKTYLSQFLATLWMMTLLLSLAGCAGYGTSNSVQASDAASRTRRYNAGTSLQIATGLLPNGTVQVPYSTKLGATSGVPPYRWSLSSGSLPAGLSIDSLSGAITGMPSQAGGYTFTVQVKDSQTHDGDPAPQTATKTFIINIANIADTPPPQITTNSLASGQVSASYLVALTGTGGTQPFTWSILSGSLPSGLSLNTSIGAISGTPSQAGTFAFALQLKDANGQTAQQSFSLVIAAAAATVVPLSINTPGLPGGITQRTYVGTLSASGGATPYTWSVPSGSLPPGLNLNASTGAITGTPTTTGTFNFTVQARDSSPTPQTASASASVLIVAPLQIATTSLPAPQLQTSYSATLTVSGGMAPYVWGISSGSLPSGLTLNSSTGVISGVPTTAGSYTFTVQVSDPPSIPQTATAQLTASVPAPALQIAISSLPGGQVQLAYSATLSVSGGTAPYSWSVASGSLPSGLTLAASSGVISGTPTASGSYSFTVQVRDSAASTASRAFTVSIAAPTLAPLQITTSSLPGGTVGAAYSATLAGSGGATPYSWSVLSGQLPTGLTLQSSTGVISGSPSTAGASGFIAQVVDSGGRSASSTFSINIAAPAPPLPSPSTTGLCGVAGDTAIHVAPNYLAFAPPARGSSYNDQQYGCPITRVTDAVAQGFAGGTAHHRYSTRIPFNSDNTKILLEDNSGFQFITDLTGNILFAPGSLQPDNNSGSVWSNTNPNVIYFHSGNQIKKMDISSGTPVYTVLHTFSQFGELSDIRSKENLSFDGDNVLFYGDRDTTGALGVYTISSDTVGPIANGFTPAAGLDYADLTPSNQVMVVWSTNGTGRNQGTELWDQNMNFIKQIKPTNDHGALGRDLNGNDILVFEASNDATRAAPCQSTSGMEIITLSTLAKTCPISFSFALSGHYSLYNVNGGQYALVSIGDHRNPGTNAVPVESNYATDWLLYANELLLVKVDGSEIRRLAHFRSIGEGDGYYWPLAKAAISRDGKYLIFSSNYQQNTSNSNYDDEYVLKIQ